jgi:hypothetical protein
LWPWIRSIDVGQRWSIEQVEAIAPSAASVTAAQPLASPSRWQGAGADDQALWGSCQGSGAEPYDTMVDHVRVGFACTCPSRKRPCKHAIALLLLWVRGQVAESIAPSKVDGWVSRRSGATDTAPRKADAGSDVETADADATFDGGATSDDGAPGEPSGNESEPEALPDIDRDQARNDRVERMYAGLTELDRWLDDRIRTGLADASLASYNTWDSLAARLVDAQAGSLANRIRRLAGLVGASPGWHDDVLAELGMLHLLSQAGRRLGSLPGPLADAVATSVGWQIRQADVLAGVPDTDQWIVAGRSDTREDRIEVRRIWLRGAISGRWALVLSFAAYQQSLDTSLVVGTSVEADLHRYPGPALRALVGARHAEPLEGVRPPVNTVAGACDELGSMLANEPWLDRLAVTVRASPTRFGSRWVLTDDTGSLPVLESGHFGSGTDISTLLAVSGGGPVDMTVEWTPHGVVPLAIHLAGRSIDIGPRADGSFVSAA